MNETMVVGGAGFVGSHLVDRLIAEGFATDVVDDLSTGSLANLAEARNARASLKIHTLNVGAPEFDELVSLRRPTVIFHLALLTAAHGSSGDAITTTLAVLEAARRHSVGKVVVAVPASDLYGEAPARELPIKESRPFASPTVRGVLARSVVDLLNVFRSEFAVEHTALAMTSVYGPRQRPTDGVVAAFMAATDAGEPMVVHGDGRQSRDLLYIDDAVDALIRAGHRGSGLVVNVGTGTSTTIRDLAALIDPHAAVVTSPRRRGDLARLAVSPTRARIHLAWEPWTDLRTGLDTLRLLG